MSRGGCLFLGSGEHRRLYPTTHEVACTTLRNGDIDADEVVGYPGRVDVFDEMIGTGGMNRWSTCSVG